MDQEKGRIGESSSLTSPAEWYTSWQEFHTLYTRGRTSPVAPAAYSNPLWDIKSSLAIEGSLCFEAICRFEQWAYSTVGVPWMA